MDAAALRARGNAQFASGDYAAAQASYSETLRLLDAQADPTGIHVLYGNRAAAALKLGQWAAALQDAEAALAAEPRWAKALYRKAAALQGLGRLAAAAAAARQALQIEPSNREVQAMLRQLEQAQGSDGAAPGQQHPAGAAAPAAEAELPPTGPRKPAPSAALLPPLLERVPWENVPAADGVDENLLLLLHGLGDRPAAFASLARRMALPQTAAVALGGPQEVPFSDGGRSWYTVFTPDFDLIEGRAGEQRRTRSLAQAVAALQQLLAALQRACGYKPRCVHLLGFSQGGTVALELARQQQACGQPVGSCIAVSAAVLPEQLVELRQQQRRQAQQQQHGQQQSAGDGAGGGGGTPVLITRGTLDKVISQQRVEETAEVLRSVHGMAVDVHSVPGKAHAMPQGEAEMRRLMAFWAQHLSRRPTAADLPPEAAGAGGELLEVRPGEVSIELVGEQQG
ncbi:hypothetical protein ABPG75_006122 [Micractinium tetrahymenae]